jgi:membrane protein DedA with SNARE-associated domain
MHAIETSLIDFIRSLFDSLGWSGVVLAMAIESACIPLPSELTMPLAGWLLVAEHHTGWPGILLASFWGAVGNLLGSIVAYGVGAFGGRPLLERYGRYVLITRKDLDRSQRWFDRWGEATAFGSRLLPVVRTFISLPAGVARMPFGRFCLFTFAGSYLWCVLLVWIGYRLGPDWEQLRERARWLDYPIAAVVVVGVLWFVGHRLAELRRERSLT